MQLDRKTCLRAGVTVFLVYLAITYWKDLTHGLGLLLGAASPLIIGGVIAYILNILMSFFERIIAPKSRNKTWIKARRPVCLLLAFATLVIGVFLLIRLILPQLVSCFGVLLSALPEAVQSLYAKLMENETIATLMTENSIALPASEAEWRTLLEKATGFLWNGASAVMSTALNFVTSLVGTVFSGLMALIFTINILISKETLADQSKQLLQRAVGVKRMDFVMHFVNILDSCFHNYIVGQCIEALILGSLCTLGMLILQLDYAVMVGAVVGVLALIPIAGAYIAGAVGAIMLFSVDPSKALIFIVFLVVLQQIEGNLIFPHTVGSKMKLPGIWVLAAVTVGGGVMGITGMIIFVPLTAAVYRLLGEWVRRDKRLILPSNG